MLSIYKGNLNFLQNKKKWNCNGKPGLYNDASGIRSYKHCIVILYNSKFYHTVLFKILYLYTYKQFKIGSRQK